MTTDSFSPATICLHWTKQDVPDDAPAHSHVCREPRNHRGPHVCICNNGTEFQ